MKPHALLILTVSLFYAADDPKVVAVKKDLEQLKGAWIATSYVKDMKPAPAFPE